MQNLLVITMTIKVEKYLVHNQLKMVIWYGYFKKLVANAILPLTVYIIQMKGVQLNNGINSYV